VLRALGQADIAAAAASRRRIGVWHHRVVLRRAGAAPAQRFSSTVTIDGWCCVDVQLASRVRASCAAEPGSAL
jgi:hypothetical protein